METARGLRRDLATRTIDGATLQKERIQRQRRRVDIARVFIRPGRDNRRP